MENILQAHTAVAFATFLAAAMLVVFVSESVAAAIAHLGVASHQAELSLGAGMAAAKLLQRINTDDSPETPTLDECDSRLI